MGPDGRENKREAVLSLKVSQECLPNPEENFSLPTAVGTPSPVSALKPHTLRRT